ncbi:hypothetical protein CSQ85_10595 [Bifidobacterium rousetti]|uniref:hypothetical protein n=1 Tax=Bifidobacterium rousetti TaxID=2045439 RepID=UPI00123A3B3A|nr:hypothetical protein [Bifidobacterium rousetti]KAA8817987.1 hypothetical protein CSQ85_10595 [Bifidobacterium rousetti]
MRDKDEAQAPSEGIRNTQVNPVIVVVATAVVAMLMFAGAYAAGRSATKPTDSPEYRALVSDIADVKKRTAANKARAKELTGEVEQLEEKQQAADKRLEEAKQAYQRYVPAGSVTDQPLTVESLDVTVDNSNGTGMHVHPKFVVRNTSGHIITKIEIVGDIVRPDGSMVSDTQVVSADDIRLMPGRTAVIEEVLFSQGGRGDLFKPKHYYYQAASDSQSKDVQFGGDVTAKVIS